MAAPAQVANDLVAQARRYGGTGNDELVRSLMRGSMTIKELLKRIDALERGEPAP
jgi:hypothetical protein